MRFYFFGNEGTIAATAPLVFEDFPHPKPIKANFLGPFARLLGRRCFEFEFDNRVESAIQGDVEDGKFDCCWNFRQ